MYTNNHATFTWTYTRYGRDPTDESVNIRPIGLFDPIEITQFLNSSECISEKLYVLRLISTTKMTDYFFQFLLIAFWSRRILGGSHSFKGNGRRIFRLWQSFSRREGRAGGGAITRIKSYGISRDSTQYDLVITSPIARILGRLLSSNVIEAQSEVSNRDSFFMRYSCSPV